MTIRPVAAEGQCGLPIPEPTTRSYWLHAEDDKDGDGGGGKGRKGRRDLRGHQTTPELPREADVVIVGSGITGAFAAHFLLEGEGEGTGDGELEVLMLEARDPCSGATGRNGGHCQPLLYSSDPDVAAFELETYAFLRDYAASRRVPCDWRSLTGVHVFLTGDHLALARDVVERLRRRRPELAALLELVDPQAPDGSDEEREGARRRLAELRVPGVEGAVVQGRAASLWPYKLVCFVLEELLEKFPPPSSSSSSSSSSAQGEGVGTAAAAGSEETKETETEETQPKKKRGWFNLQSNTVATRLAPTGDRARPWLVHTLRGPVAARRVLLATNAYTSALLPAFADLIVPVRGQVGALVVPPSSSSSSSLAAAEASGEGKGEEGDDRREEKKERFLLDHSYVFLGTYSDEQGRLAPRNEYLVQRPLIPSSSPSGSGGGELILGGGRDHAAHRAVGEWRDDVLEAPVASYLREALLGVLDLEPRGSGSGGSGQEEDKKQSGEDKKEEEEPEEEEPLEATYEWTGIMGYSRTGHPWVGRVPPSSTGIVAPRPNTYSPYTTYEAYAAHNAHVAASAAAEAAGGRPASVTGFEEDRDSGLYLCAGYTGHGMPVAALCARAVARMILRDEHDASSESGSESASKTEKSGGEEKLEALGLPANFLLTEERMSRARREFEEVAAGERGGVTGDMAKLCFLLAMEERQAV